MGPDPVRWQRVEASEASAARSTVRQEVRVRDHGTNDV